jgi:hypothetical protein
MVNILSLLEKAKEVEAANRKQMSARKSAAGKARWQNLDWLETNIRTQEALKISCQLNGLKPRSENQLRTAQELGRKNGPKSALIAAAYVKGGAWVYKEGCPAKRIPAEEIEAYLSAGYLRGRPPYPNKTTSGCVWVHKGDKAKFVLPSQIEEFLTLGYKRGRPPSHFVRGDKHWSRHRAGNVVKGERSGAHTHPEKVPRGANHYARLHPEKMAKNYKARANTEITKRIIRTAGFLLRKAEVIVTRPMLSKIRRAYRKAGIENPTPEMQLGLCKSLLAAGVPILNRTSYRLSKFLRGTIKDVRSL